MCATGRCCAETERSLTGDAAFVPRDARQRASMSARNAATRSRTSSRTGTDAVSETRIRHELGVRKQRNGRSKEVDLREWIGFAGQQEDRAADRWPVSDPCVGPFGPSRRMQRVAEEDERGVRRVWLRRCEAGDPATERMAANDDVGGRRHDRVEGRKRIFGLASRKIDGDRVEAAFSKPGHERRHRRRRAAGPMAEEAAKAHSHSLAASPAESAAYGPIGSYPGIEHRANLAGDLLRTCTRLRAGRRSPPVSYLRGSLDRTSAGAAYDAGSPYATWSTVAYTTAQLSSWFGADSRTSVGTLIALDLRNRGASGRLISVTLIGSRATRTVSGEVFRSIFNARHPATDPSMRSTLVGTQPIP